MATGLGGCLSSNDESPVDVSIEMDDDQPHSLAVYGYNYDGANGAGICQYPVIPGSEATLYVIPPWTDIDTVLESGSPGDYLLEEHYQHLFVDEESTHSPREWEAYADEETDGVLPVPPTFVESGPLGDEATFTVYDLDPAQVGTITINWTSADAS